MKLLLATGFTAVATTFTGVSVNVATIDSSYEEVYSYFNENVSEMTSAYEEEYSTKWNATVVEEVTDIYNTNDEHLGYLVIFDEGYLSYNSNLSVLDVSTTGYPSYYNTQSTLSLEKQKIIYHSGTFSNSTMPSTYDVATIGDSTADDIYYPLIDYYYNEDFTINYSMVQIPYFKDSHDSSSWGNYMGISFSYFGQVGSGVMSTMGLMYTLKVNNIADLTPYQLSYTSLSTQLHFYVAFDYTYTSYIEPTTLYHGVNQYLEDNFGDKYRMGAIYSPDVYNPAVTLYYNSNAVQTAEYCMRIGHAQKPAWWIFNTYYDIVMANDNNFYYNEYMQPLMWLEDSLTPFYVVNQNYRNEMFQFFEGNTVLS